MRPTLLLIVLAVVGACGCGAEPSGAPTPAAPAAAPVSPCTTDADCRVESATGCACIAALASSPPGPGCPHPCVVDPCAGNEGFCHTPTSTCRVRPSSH